MTRRIRVLKIVGTVIHGLIAALLLFAGSGKAFGFAPEEVVKTMQSIGMGDKLQLIGWGELITALLLILPRTSSLGTLLASGFWGGVICIHMAHGDPYLPWAIALAFTWLGALLRTPEMFHSFVAARQAPTDVTA